MLVNGLHALLLPHVRSCLDVAVYLDPDERLRRLWKLRRDVATRGSSVESVRESFTRREPDRRRWVEPQRSHAQLVLGLVPALDELDADAPAVDGETASPAVDLEPPTDGRPWPEPPLALRVQCPRGPRAARAVQLLQTWCRADVELHPVDDLDTLSFTVRLGTLLPGDLNAVATALLPDLEDVLAREPEWAPSYLGRHAAAGAHHRRRAPGGGVSAPTLVVLDLDDTLIDYVASHEVARRALLRRAEQLLRLKRADIEAAFDEGRRQIKEQVGPTAASHNRLLYLQRGLELLGLGPQVETAVTLERTYWRTLLLASAVFPGVVDFLDRGAHRRGHARAGHRPHRRGAVREAAVLPPRPARRRARHQRGSRRRQGHRQAAGAAARQAAGVRAGRQRLVRRRRRARPGRAQGGPRRADLPAAREAVVAAAPERRRRLHRLRRAHRRPRERPVRHALVLAGGSGTRLWPYSTAALPKQLVPLLQGRSLLDIAVERATAAVPADRVWLGAGEQLRGAV